MNDYLEFIENKTSIVQQTCINVNIEDLNKYMFDFQKYIVQKALKLGRFAIFADCGLGKTLMQIEFANQVVKHTGRPVLILAPLAVSGQTIKEGVKFGIDIQKYSNQKDKGIYIINYEQLKNIDCSIFAGVVLDESSILKNFTGAYRNLIIENFASTDYKLACTATPSPNDELEIGNHAEFLNVMTSSDMRAKFFTTDKEIIKGNKYRLKRHGISEFYTWVSSWAIMISNPSDIGFKNDGYSLPPLNFIEHQVESPKKENNLLFDEVSVSATTFNNELRLTADERMDSVLKIVNNSDENFIIWIKHNTEAEFLAKNIEGAVNVSGSDSPEYKEKMLLGFANNEFRVLITKTKIAQFGLNYQNCRNQIFASLDFSFEGLYQAIRRSYRFGQKNEVNIHLISVSTMQNVIGSIQEKQEKFNIMQNEMQKAMNGDTVNVSDVTNNGTVYIDDDFTVINGDCVLEAAKLADNSIDYSFFSPPFGALYVFSNDPLDMSNVKNNDEFLKQFKFLVNELLRITKPGRLVSLHMMQSTTLLGRDGYYSIVDFRGDLIRMFIECGFYFHAENMIRKDPKTAAIRTKNRQLMHGTTKKDSSIVRPGLADYILTFRKPGENEVPIQNDIPFDLWCKIAEPVWIDVEEGDTLTYRAGKDKNDERHITPTQLKPIEWCYLMWANKGDTVFSPFSGVASEGYQAVKMGRKYIGIELKKSYFDLSIKNLLSAKLEKQQTTLF
jgi:DNA modification methylase